MKPEIDVFREFLAHKGMRATPEREAILGEVFVHHDHFDVEELIMRLRQNGQRISRASVYRTMALLVESGLVQEVFIEDGHMHYEHVYGHEHHCHLRCLAAGRSSSSGTKPWRAWKSASARPTGLPSPATNWRSTATARSVRKRRNS